MTDITSKDDQELSFIVFNTEDIYNIRHNTYFISLITSRFLATNKQIQVLLADLENDQLNQNITKVF